jgi:hypothetical protein
MKVESKTKIKKNGNQITGNDSIRQNSMQCNPMQSNVMHRRNTSTSSLDADENQIKD